MIKIGLNGAWDADAVNFFSTKIVRFFSKNTNQVCKLLNSYKAEDRQSYFRFLLDNNSYKKNKINIDVIYEKCSIHVYNDFILANKTYDLIYKINDNDDRPSVQRYDLNFLIKIMRKFI